MRGEPNKRNRYLLAGAGLFGLLALSAPEARAQNMQEIQAQIDQMQATIQALEKQVQDAKAQAAQATTAAANAGVSDLDLKVKWSAPELSSATRRSSSSRSGWVETDYNNIGQDTPITFAPTSRRRRSAARLGVEGVMFYD
jgi:Tfp pilus assembly protein FimV